MLAEPATTQHTDTRITLANTLANLFKLIYRLSESIFNTEQTKLWM